MAFLAAIRTCAMHGLVIPEWAADAYFDAFDRVANFEIGSWDTAFGKPYGNKHLAALRKRYEIQELVFEQIVQRLAREVPPPPIDAQLFESVGAEFGIKKTLCAELYYLEVKKLFPPD